MLTRCGVATTYYDPLIGEGIAKLMRPNTKVVYTESPGSLTFEVQDIPAIAAAAHAAGAKVLMDNTWATPWLFPLVRARRRRVDPCRDQIHRRPFRCDARRRHHHRGDVSAGAHDGRRSRPLRRARRRLFRAARPAHAVACGSNGIRRTRSKWRAGCKPGPKCRACSIRPCPTIRAMPCGSAISSAPAASSAWC